MINYNLTEHKPGLLAWAKLLTDDQLVASFKAGNSSAFEVLLHRYYRLLYWYIRRHVDDHEKRDDVFQDTVVYIHSHILDGKYSFDTDNPEYFKALFLTSAKWQSLAVNNPKIKWNQNITLDINYHKDISSTDTQEEDDGIGMHERLANAVLNLPKEEKQVIVLTTYMNCSISEVATLMHTNNNVAVSRYNRAIQSLKTALIG